MEGYTSDTILPVAVGKTASYKCDGYPDKVTDTGAEWPITCGEKGVFVPPEEWPECR